MVKKFICPICGYVHEGTEAPERCPQCKVPASKFKEVEESGLQFASEHELGIAEGECRIPTEAEDRAMDDEIASMFGSAADEVFA